MTWRRDLAKWSLGAAVSLTLTLAIPGAAAGSPTPLKPAVTTAADGEAFPLIAKGDKKDKGKSPPKSPGKSDRGSSKSKSKSSNDSKAKQRDSDRQRADDARRREATRQKAREDDRRREDARRKASDAKRRDDARRQEDARRRAAQLKERENARRRADDARQREQARQRADESRRREDARKRADELRRRLENQRRADDARRREPQRPTRPTVRPGTEPQRTPPDTRSRTTPDRRSNDPPRFDRGRDSGGGGLNRRLPPSQAPRTTPRRGPDVVAMPPGTRPDSPGTRDVLRRRPDRWSDPGGTTSRRTPTIGPDGRGSVLPRITPDRTPVLHVDDPPVLSRPPRVPVGPNSHPGDSYGPFQPELPHVWSGFDGDHGGGGGGGDDQGGGGGGNHHDPPHDVIEHSIHGHDYHYNYGLLHCHRDSWRPWHWRHRGWRHWNWWYCDGWDGWSFWFGFWGGHSSHWWFSFSFGSGGDWCVFGRPWRAYTCRYDGCYVRYHRPWRSWCRRHYVPYRYFAARRPSYRWNYWDSGRYVGDPDWYGSYRSSTPVYYVVQTTYEPALPSIDDAWSRLRSGNIEAARDMFGDLVYALPYEGEARIGYAIASGLLSRDDAAVSAMRRALRDEPSALRAVPRDSIMRDQLRGLLDFYADRARRNFGDTDALFMVAALRYLLDEPSVAYFAADAAIRSGDDDEATHNLKLLIEETMYESF